MPSELQERRMPLSLRSSLLAQSNVTAPPSHHPALAQRRRLPPSLPQLSFSERPPKKRRLMPPLHLATTPRLSRTSSVPRTTHFLLPSHPFPDTVPRGTAAVPVSAAVRKSGLVNSRIGAQQVAHLLSYGNISTPETARAPSPLPPSSRCTTERVRGPCTRRHSWPADISGDPSFSATVDRTTTKLSRPVLAANSNRNRSMRRPGMRRRASEVESTPTVPVTYVADSVSPVDGALSVCAGLKSNPETASTSADTEPPGGSPKHCDGDSDDSDNDQNDICASVDMGEEQTPSPSQRALLVRSVRDVRALTVDRGATQLNSDTTTFIRTTSQPPATFHTSRDHCHQRQVETYVTSYEGASDAGGTPVRALACQDDNIVTTMVESKDSGTEHGSVMEALSTVKTTDIGKVVTSAVDSSHVIDIEALTYYPSYTATTATQEAAAHAVAGAASV